MIVKNSFKVVKLIMQKYLERKAQKGFKSLQLRFQCQIHCDAIWQRIHIS